MALISTLFTRSEWESKLAEVEHRKEDMNKMVLNYLVSKGYLEAAEKFRLDSGTENFDLATCFEVKEVVESGNVEDIIKKLNEMNPELLDSNIQLCFRVQQQQFIELIRNEKAREALEFAQNKFGPTALHCPDFFQEEFERTFVLLSFEDVNDCPVSDLLHMSQRRKTANEINAAIASQGHETDPKLSSFFKWLSYNQNELGKVALHPSIRDLSTAVIEDSF